MAPKTTVTTTSAPETTTPAPVVKKVENKTWVNRQPINIRTEVLSDDQYYFFNCVSKEEFTGTMEEFNKMMKG